MDKVRRPNPWAAAAGGPRPGYEKTWRGWKDREVDRLREVDPPRGPNGNPFAGSDGRPRDGYQNSFEAWETRGSTGVVYVLTNPFMRGLLKIGRTRGSAADRAAELRGTGVPGEFRIAFETPVAEPEAVEREAHRLLVECRVSADREFFRCSTEEAIAAVQEASLRRFGSR